MEGAIRKAKEWHRLAPSEIEKPRCPLDYPSVTGGRVAVADEALDSGRASAEHTEDEAKDLSARIGLMDAIAERIRPPTEEGGLAVSISAELGFVEVTWPEVTSYYVFTIFDKLLSRSLGLRHAQKMQEEFVSGPVPHTTYLDGIPVALSADANQLEQAVRFLVTAQENWLWFPEVKRAAEAYQEARTGTKAVNPQLGVSTDHP